MKTDGHTQGGSKQIYVILCLLDEKECRDMDPCLYSNRNANRAHKMSVALERCDQQPTL
jgi:hypothetical protein